MKDTRPRGRRIVARVPEKIVQAQIVNLLRSIGASVHVLGTKRRAGDYQGTNQSPGIPDLWVFLPARPAGLACGLWVEVKAEGGRLRPAQADFRAACEIAGVPHLVGGVEEVVALLMRGGWLKPENVPFYRHGLPPGVGPA